MRSFEDLAAMMPGFAASPEIQLRQTRFRTALIESWNVREGTHILEVGCGQGETTIALADAVGPHGRVTAVDAAGPEYGAPVTLGESTAAISRTELGRRIDFRLGFDLLASANPFGLDAFDAIVMAHCSWYFGSIEELGRTFEAVRHWGRRLLFSEWNLESAGPDQVSHLLAVLLRAQMEGGKDSSEANIVTPTSLAQVRDLLERSGWRISSESDLDSSYLDDARWEIEDCLRHGVDAGGLIRTQTDILRAVHAKVAVRSLNSYSIVAERVGSR